MVVLRYHGFRIAIDDLGAGYAGLSSFVALAPEIVKLDMSLVREVHRLEIRQRLIESMASLCSEMGMRVVAEGVEAAEESECVRRLGCDLVQGYRFAKPGPPFPAVATFAEPLPDRVRRQPSGGEGAQRPGRRARIRTATAYQVITTTVMSARVASAPRTSWLYTAPAMRARLAAHTMTKTGCKRSWNGSSGSSVVARPGSAADRYADSGDFASGDHDAPGSSPETCTFRHQDGVNILIERDGAVPAPHSPARQVRA